MRRKKVDDLKFIYHKLNLFKEKNNLFVKVILFNIFEFIIFLNKNFYEKMEEKEYLIELDNKYIHEDNKKTFETTEEEQQKLFNREIYLENVKKLFEYMFIKQREKFISRAIDEIFKNVEEYRNYPFRSLENLTNFSTIGPINKVVGAFLRDEKIINGES